MGKGTGCGLVGKLLIRRIVVCLGASILAASCSSAAKGIVAVLEPVKGIHNEIEIDRATGRAESDPHGAALTLTGAATFAARSGDCSIVEEVDAHVRELDGDAYEAFVDDGPVA